MFELLYAAVTRWRRHYVEPRRLARPVISIGNLAAGGRGKTPMAELVARVLLRAGERPSILSRGYARARSVDQPVIVRDAQAVRAPLDVAGDEPLMLAEHLDGAIVVVSADRGRAGVIAEQLGATVHVLDDGFQHVRVARDIDIVMLDARDPGGEVMPAGHLREPFDALEYADAIVMIADDPRERADAAQGLGEIPGVRTFTGARRVLPPQEDLAGSRAFLVSGLADNDQFAWAAGEAGWQLCGHARFKDHHRYSQADADAIARQASGAGAAFALTTAKDAVRLRELWRADLALHIAELKIELDERAAFDQWLIGRLTHARVTRREEERRRRRGGARVAS